MTNKAKPRGKIKTAQRVFDVLELVRNRDGVTISEASEELNVATSTAHGYLTTLEEVGYLVREEEKFYLGLTFLQYGRASRERLEYIDIVDPTLEKVAKQTEEAVQYVAEESEKAIYLLEKKGANATRTEGKPGMPAPLHATAAGKAILSGLPDERLNRVTLVEYTDETITDREALREEIAHVRKEGVAYNDNERTPGLRAVACPIEFDECIIGAISVGGPAERIRSDYFDEELPRYLRGVANEIELNISGLSF